MGLFQGLFDRLKGYLILFSVSLSQRWFLNFSKKSRYSLRYGRDFFSANLKANSKFSSASALEFSGT